MAAIRAGASGYLLKSMLRRELVSTIRAAHDGRRVIPDEIAVEIARHAGEETLSEREKEILECVAGGPRADLLRATKMGHSRAGQATKVSLTHSLAAHRAGRRARQRPSSDVLESLLLVLSTRGPSRGDALVAARPLHRGTVADGSRRLK